MVAKIDKGLALLSALRSRLAEPEPKGIKGLAISLAEALAPEPAQAAPPCAHDPDQPCIPNKCDASGECASRSAQAAPSYDDRLIVIRNYVENAPRKSVYDKQARLYALEAIDALRAALASERAKTCAACGDPLGEVAYCDVCAEEVRNPALLAKRFPAPDATALREADDDAVARTLQYLNAELDKRDVTIKTALERLDFARAALLRSEPRGEEGRG